MPRWGELSFIDASSFVIEQIIRFHDHVILVLVIIIVFILYGLRYLRGERLTNLSLVEGQEGEILWCSFPVLVLILIAFPSLQLLYLMEGQRGESLFLKVRGYQWFWKYYYHNFDLEFLSRRKRREEVGQFLSVDNVLVLPFGYPIQVMVRASDVIHSWTIPSLGIKVDAVPGRTNFLLFRASRRGIFTGQCSEICGVQHRFRPIILEFVTVGGFEQYINRYIVN